MTVLLVVQQQEGRIQKSSLCALTAARQVAARTGAPIAVLALGGGAAAAASLASKYGCAQLLYSEHPQFEKYRSAPYAAAVVKAAHELGVQVIVAAATSQGKDLMPRVAALLNAGQASDIVSVHDDGSYRRPMFAGNVFADVEVVTPVQVLTVRTTAFPAAGEQPGGGSARELAVDGEPAGSGEVVSYDRSGGERPELADAEIVVSGGRAMQSAENFQKYIFPLADALGAAVGASRAAVDSGYAPNDWQVGQTGKVVAPNLYIAVGISGAIQHLAGMKDSKAIVAINKNPDEPIFEVADFGLVADLFTAVPELTEKIKRAKSG